MISRNSLLLAIAVSLCLSGTVWAQGGSTPKRSSSGLSSRGTTLHSLPSLTGDSSARDTTVPGRVGAVRVPSVSIRVGRRSSDKALAIVTEGTNLAILTEKDGYYGVLMQDSTLGWLPTGDVALLDYRVQVRMPDSPPSSDPSIGSTESTPSPEISSDADPRTAVLLREAFSYLGVPYVWAGNTRSGLDCSAFLKKVFATAWGIDLPRHSGDQAKYGSVVTSTDYLQAGDRLYFDMGRKGRISHCGIYIGNGYFIHASSNRHCVGVDRLSTPNYWNALVAARHDG